MVILYISPEIKQHFSPFPENCQTDNQAIKLHFSVSKKLGRLVLDLTSSIVEIGVRSKAREGNWSEILIILNFLELSMQ